MLVLVAFAAAAGCLLGLSALMVASLLAPERRLWPAGDDDRKRRVYLAFSRPLLPAVFATGVLNWNAGPLAAPWHLGVGAVGALVAFGVLGRSAVDLGEEATEGRKDELRTDGLYRYTRNPQNVGYVLLFATYAVLANSPLVGVLTVEFAVVTVLQVLAEEAWLREVYGDAYDEYCERVPRFVGVRTLTRAFGDD
ncbi:MULTISPECIES: isoprenylcysteine carboxylmethyltransferase family protein [unclassified Halorubrum]|uniref:methyltransferase family protein n=1 Tax=unclassified Halorubrum TaxID=2642239 RepID=UPI0010F4F362|nr:MULTISPECIES: isoprenylcysteine carboxylmethyltransferase family protein [unclassified Halorubrum]TKX42696.1 isoprenylcysteine carboxylmethyltransferase family protein [Halorubrum sp. ARQ200]TKX51394.1 isoprenylcysteine carboxylmethyltransferase family protein [Halorubrum sp. ASP121]